MNSRFRVAAVVLVLIVSAAAGVRAADSKDGGGDGSRPNIIFLLTDDQRADALGCMGNPIIKTPHIDRLAEGGVVFENAFVTTSICMISRASILTGQYASRHGITGFGRELSNEQLANTYLGQLDRAGYRTGFIGKWGVGRPPKAWDYNKGFPGQNRYIHKVGGETRHLTTMLGDQAVEFLEGSEAGEPFALSISFKTPHVQDSANVNRPTFIHDPDLAGLYSDVTIPRPPLAAPAFYEQLPNFLKNSENRARWAVRFWSPARYQQSVKGYYRLITGVDRQVGRIMKTLRERGLAENTIVVFSSDNGFYLGERGFAGKWFPHEVSIRVPLIVHDPRLLEERRGERVDAMALNIDLAPTMLAYAGIEPPSAMQGRSLLPLVRGSEGGVGGPPDSWREAFFYEHPFEHRRIPRSQAVRTERWKYIRYPESDPLYEELYDLKADPHEARNLAADPAYAERMEMMRAASRKWRERVKGDF